MYIFSMFITCKSVAFYANLKNSKQSLVEERAITICGPQFEQSCFMQFLEFCGPCQFWKQVH